MDGIPKLARLLDTRAGRMQVQGKMTALIANTLTPMLQPCGSAMVMECGHHCMSTRGVYRPGVLMAISTMLGRSSDDHHKREEFTDIVGRPTNRLP